MRLFDIDKILENLLEMGDDWVDSETGEILSYHEIELLEMERSAKIEGWGCWIKNQMSDAAALKAEIENMQARLKALNTKIESSTRRYQEYLNAPMWMQMLAAAGAKLEVDELFTYSNCYRSEIAEKTKEFHNLLHKLYGFKIEDDELLQYLEGTHELYAEPEKEVA